jgi:hypothetical protein
MLLGVDYYLLTVCLAPDLPAKPNYLRDHSLRKSLRVKGDHVIPTPAFSSFLIAYLVHVIDQVVKLSG